jgi:hypothetical protein
MEHPEVTDFIAYLHLKNLAPATIRGYRLALKGLFDYIVLGPSPPSQITAALRQPFTHSRHEPFTSTSPSSCSGETSVQATGSGQASQMNKNILATNFTNYHELK